MNEKEKKLLNTLILEAINETGLTDEPLYKAFIEPFTDIIQTARRGAERVLTTTSGELGILTRQIVSMLIPSLATPEELSEKAKKERARIEQRLSSIDKRFKDVIERNWSTLNDLDTWGTFFLINPSLAIGQKLVTHAPGVALELLQSLTAGHNQKITELLKKYRDLRTGGEYGNLDIHKAAFQYGPPWGDHGNEGGISLEQAIPQQQTAVKQVPMTSQDIDKWFAAQVKQLLNDPQVKQQINSSSLTKAMQQEAVNLILNSAKENIPKITFETIKQKAGDKLKSAIEKFVSKTGKQKIDIENDKEFQKTIVDSLKAAAKEPYIKQLESLLKLNPSVAQYVSQAIQTINNL